MSVVIDGTLGITSPAETVQGALTTTGNTILGDASTDTLNVGNGGLVKDASGNVGIGTASPGVKLDIRSSGQTYLSIGDSSDSSRGITLRSGTAADPYASVDTNSSARQLSFGVDGTKHANITLAGLFQFNSGYGSVATAYGCRAWVNFNGTGTVAIRASGNVSSITDNGTGDYTVNFTTALVDANYSAVGQGSQMTTDGRNQFEYGVVRTTTAYRFATLNNSNTFIDSTYASISIFR